MKSIGAIKYIRKFTDRKRDVIPCVIRIPLYKLANEKRTEFLLNICAVSYASEFKLICCTLSIFISSSN